VFWRAPHSSRSTKSAPLHFFPAKHPSSKNSRSTKSMDLAPNSTKSIECLKGYYVKPCFILTRGVRWKLPTFATHYTTYRFVLFFSDTSRRLLLPVRGRAFSSAPRLPCSRSLPHGPLPAGRTAGNAGDEPAAALPLLPSVFASSWPPSSGKPASPLGLRPIHCSVAPACPAFAVTGVVCLFAVSNCVGCDRFRASSTMYIPRRARVRLLRARTTCPPACPQQVQAGINI
jgi:hypothetical protein